MSKHNRERRRHPWRCQKCGAPMHRELHATSAARRMPPEDVVHICGACQALHHAVDGGGLRLLTPAEEFALHVEVPNAMERVPAACREVNSDQFAGIGIMQLATD